MDEHRPEDLADCVAIYANVALTRHDNSGKVSTRTESWARVLRFAGSWSLLGFGYWAVREAGSGGVSGDPLGGRRAAASGHRLPDRSGQRRPAAGGGEGRLRGDRTWTAGGGGDDHPAAAAAPDPGGATMTGAAG